MPQAPSPPPGKFRRQALARAVGGDSATPQGNPGRREFLRGGLAAGLALGLPPLLAGCGGSDDESPVPQENRERRTLFFNLTHFDHAGRSHFVVGGGERHALVPVADDPAVLAEARRGNAFLRDVPDRCITHHVQGMSLPTDSVTVCYQGLDIDTAAGTWAMTGVFFNIPSSGAAAAYRHARARTPTGPLPMSAKRQLYGLRAAESEDDMRLEPLLVDTASYAAAMIGAHPDLMSLHPDSAQVVHANYIATDINTLLLTQRLQDPAYGPAMPAQAPGVKNPTGWGTLVPLTDANGVPLKNQAGRNKGRIHYQPAYHPDVAAALSSASALVPAVKNDATLGADITGRQPASGPTATATDPDPTLAGAMWFRHDGIANVDVSRANTAASASTVSMALKNSTPGAWLWSSATSTVNRDGSVQIDLKLLNWGLRFLGVYVQFLKTTSGVPTVVPLADIAEYNSGTIVAGHDTGMDTKDTMFLGMLGPAFTVLGIPTAPGFVLPSLRMPAQVEQVRVLAGGLAFTGSNIYPQTVVAGAVMTGVFNYGVTALMAAAGAAATFSVFMKDAVVPFAKVLAPELIALISAELKKEQDVVDLLLSPAFWESQGLILGKWLVTRAVSGQVKAFVDWLVEDLTAAVVEDEIPVAGWLMLGISIGVGVVSLAETSVELALSPWTFVDDISFTHDLAVTLQPDSNDGTFPKDADRYTVTALFDDGTPHVQTLAMPSRGPTTLPPVRFPGVPLGGQVNVSVAFHQAGTATAVDVLLGKGTTGLVPNNATDAVPPLVVQELKFPIDATTVYRHQQKTRIDDAGRHVWTPGPAPTANPGNSGGSGPGTISALNALTVRQSTSRPPRAGYIGYAWSGQSTDPSKGAACVGGGTGQLDLVANVNTTDATLGYATSACGLPPGVRVAYNLLSHGSANFYLDTSDPNAPTLRQVLLEPAPSIDNPLSGKAWGVLNLSSDALLLHPAGHLISLNTVGHKLETHRLPAAPLADKDARVQLRAQLRGGQGTRPGLVTNPQHAAVAPDGTVLVLEAGDPNLGIPGRVQAFDLAFNPVRYFARQALPYVLTLTETPNDKGWAYLDLAVEFTGFIYVLSYNENSFDHRLDIYHPSQTGTRPIATTTQVNAGKIAIDFWRNVYTLNYEVLTRPTPGLAEPSVSLWVPSRSCVGADCVPS